MSSRQSSPGNIDIVNRWRWNDSPNAPHAVGARMIGNAVRRSRLRRGMSQQSLAGRSRVTQPTISRLETAKLRGMSFLTLAGIFGALGVPLDIDEIAPARRRLPGQAEAEATGGQPR